VHTVCVEVQPVSHAPFTQRWPMSHAAPHAPQFAALESRSTHEPLHCVAPESHVHAPAAQVAVPPHWCAQAPQLSPLVCRSTHALLQSVRLDAHDVVHVPALQTWSAAQAVPQAPQLVGSLLTCAQTPRHRCPPPAQTHAPAEQTVPPVHRVPHAPQLSASD
jgi:hypothetical protein